MAEASGRTAVTAESIQKRISILVADLALVSPEEVRLDSKPVDYGLDSLQVIDMAGRLEDEYEIAIPDAALADMANLEDLASYILTVCAGGTAVDHTLIAMLRRAAAGERGVTFIHSGKDAERMSYREWFQRSGRVASALRLRGAQFGDRLLVCLPNGADFVTVFAGCMRAGVVPCAVSPAQGFDANRALLPRLKKAAETVGAKYAVLANGDAELAREARLIIHTSRELQAEDAPEDAPSYEPTPEDVAYIQLTSGTTRAQRGAIMCHRAVCANVRQIGEASDYAPDSVGYSWLPMYHDMGLGALHVAMSYGSEMVITSPFSFIRNPVGWLKHVSEYRVTHSPAPAFGFRYILDHVTDEQLAALDLSSWKAAYIGAEPIAPAVVTEFNRRLKVAGLKESVLQPCYGMAEATLAVTMRPRGEGARVAAFSRSGLSREGCAKEPTNSQDGVTLVSCGRAVTGTELRIVDETRRQLPEGHVGEVEIRGPSMFKGYWDEHTPRLRADEFYATGDLGFLRDGELYVTGRKKEIMILSGENHHPAEIEWSASRVAGMALGGVAALGVPDGARGTEVLGLLVEADPNLDPEKRSALVAGLRRAIHEDLALAVAHVRFVPRRTIPITTSGKIKRGLLLELFRRAKDEGDAKPTSTATPNAT